MILDEFYESYLHYSVAQRLFEDRCRQLIGFKGDVDQRQALVDETLRLAMCVSDNIDDTEGLIPDVLDHLRDTDGDHDLIQAISYIANNLKEDRARANSYSNFVTYRRIGNRTRKPRRPQVANPFVPLVDDDGPVEAIVIVPKDDDAVSPKDDGSAEGDFVDQEDPSDGGSDDPGEQEEASCDSDDSDEDSEEDSDGCEEVSDSAFDDSEEESEEESEETDDDSEEQKDRSP